MPDYNHLLYNPVNPVLPDLSPYNPVNLVNSAMAAMAMFGLSPAKPIEHGKILLPYRIGFPPDDDVMNGAKQGTADAFPEDTRQFLIRMDLAPRLQTIDFSSHIFKTIDATKDYKKALRSHGIGMLTNKLHLYILSEGAISDGASSSYGPSFLGSTYNLFSSIMPRELISLARSNPAVQDFVQQLDSKVKAGGKSLEEMAKAALGEEMYGSVMNIAKSTKGLTNLAYNLAQGKRIDLPNIWQGSSSRLSYSVTVRLYNINPYDEEMYKKQIVGPIIALMALTLPRSADGIFYDRPFMVSVDCPGLFKIKEAAVTDVSIVKGGDANDISFEQHPNMVDVRISFESVYPSMVMIDDEPAEGDTSTGGETATEKQFKSKTNMQRSQDSLITTDAGPPTLSEYMDNLLDKRELQAPGKASTRGSANVKSISKGLVSEPTGGDRVSQNQIDLYNDLKNRSTT